MLTTSLVNVPQITCSNSGDAGGLAPCAAASVAEAVSMRLRPARFGAIEGFVGCLDDFLGGRISPAGTLQRQCWRSPKVRVCMPPGSPGCADGVAGWIGPVWRCLRRSGPRVSCRRSAPRSGSCSLRCWPRSSSRCAITSLVAFPVETRWQIPLRRSDKPALRRRRAPVVEATMRST